MFAYVKQSTRKVKSHLESTCLYDGGKSFPKEIFGKIGPNEKYIQVSNGTIGRGARYINISKTKLIQLLKQLE